MTTTGENNGDDKKYTFKQMGEWTQTLSHTMFEMGIRIHNHIANDPNLAVAINRSTEDIKQFIASRYALNGEMPDNVNWLLQLTLHRVIHTLIEDNLTSLTYEQPHPYEIAPESEEIFDEPLPNFDFHPEEGDPVLGVQGVYLDLRVALTPATVGKDGKLKAGAYTVGFIKAMNIEEVIEVTKSQELLEAESHVLTSLAKVAEANGVALDLVKQTTIDFLNELDGAGSIAFVREALNPPADNTSNEVPMTPAEPVDSPAPEGITDPAIQSLYDELVESDGNNPDFPATQEPESDDKPE